MKNIARKTGRALAIGSLCLAATTPGKALVTGTLCLAAASITTGCGEKTSTKPIPIQSWELTQARLKTLTGKRIIVSGHLEFLRSFGNGGSLHIAPNSSTNLTGPQSAKGAVHGVSYYRINHSPGEIGMPYSLTKTGTPRRLANQERIHLGRLPIYEDCVLPGYRRNIPKASRRLPERIPYRHNGPVTVICYVHELNGMPHVKALEFIEK